MVERQTVNLYVVGSIPTGAVYNGVSPSGKAQDSDSCTAGSSPATPV